MMQIRLFSNNLISKDRTPPRCAVLFNILYTNLYTLPQDGLLSQNHRQQTHVWHLNLNHKTLCLQYYHEQHMLYMMCLGKKNQ